MKKIVILIFCCFLLSACKVELSPTINLSDIYSETPKTIQSKLIAEVSSCTDYQDSRNESSSLIQLKEKITNIFAEAKYLECYSEKMNSKAVFEVPITVGGKKGDGDFQIRNAEFGGMIVQISKDLINKFNKANQSIPNKLNPSINITLNNDLNNSKKIVAYAVYLDQMAMPVVQYMLTPGYHTFTLSDVSVSSVFVDGETLVFKDLD